jgi:hypothetical protein
MSKSQAPNVPPWRLMVRVSASFHESKVKHYYGLPSELTEGKDIREHMPPACFLAIEKKDDGIFLYRYAQHDRCAGDTWHRTVDDAKAQATYEFNDLLSTWVQVPGGVADLMAFASELPLP